MSAAWAGSSEEAITKKPMDTTTISNKQKLLTGRRWPASGRQSGRSSFVGIEVAANRGMYAVGADEGLAANVHGFVRSVTADECRGDAVCRPG